MKKRYLLLLISLFTTTTFADEEVARSCEFNHINYKQAVSFINTFKIELQKNNIKAIADMASYPLKVNEIIKVKGKDVIRTKTIKTKQQFLQDYPAIFTKTMKNTILEDEEPIFCNYQGAMIAHGTIWFNTENDKPAFFSVNKE